MRFNKSYKNSRHVPVFAIDLMLAEWDYKQKIWKCCQHVSVQLVYNENSIFHKLFSTSVTSMLSNLSVLNYFYLKHFLLIIGNIITGACLGFHYQNIFVSIILSISLW